jgi:hypothetical protein
VEAVSGREGMMPVPVETKDVVVDVNGDGKGGFVAVNGHDHVHVNEDVNA